MIWVIGLSENYSQEIYKALYYLSLQIVWGICVKNMHIDGSFFDFLVLYGSCSCVLIHDDEHNDNVRFGYLTVIPLIYRILLLVVRF